MNRRNAISNMVALSIGAMVLPSCDQKDMGILKLKNFTLSGREEKMIHQLADAIIPKIPPDLKPVEFMLKMVDDCYDPNQQKKFLTGLQAFDKLTKDKYGSSFSSISSVQKKEWLTIMEKKKELPEEILFFYETSRKYVLQAFTTSREYMTDVLKYKMVPGSNFKGCVPVKKT